MSVVLPVNNLPVRSTVSRGPRPGFRSFKTINSIPYPARWHHDLLVQLTLDPRVVRMDAIDERAHEGVFRLSVSNGATSQILLALDDGQDRDLPLADKTLIVRRSSVLSEPHRSNARSVWAARKTPVCAGDRLRVLQALDGSPDGMTISELAACVRTPTTDAFEVILSLACLGLTALDLRRPLAPETKVRRSDWSPASPDGRLKLDAEPEA